MVTDKIKLLEATKAKVAKLEKTVASQLHKELASLHKAYGFESLDVFVEALYGAAGSRRGRKPGRRGPGRPPKARGRGRPKGSGKKRHPRSVITDETRAEVKKLVAAGSTGAQIAEALKISLPSVQNIKKALGLVKARK